MAREQAVTKEERKIYQKEWRAKHPGYHRSWYERNKKMRKKYNHEYWEKWYAENKLRKVTQNQEYRDWCKQHGG